MTVATELRKRSGRKECRLYGDSLTAGIEARKRFYFIAKELFRKTIHMGTAFVPLVLYYSRPFTVFLLVTALAVYSVVEFLRFSGYKVPVVSRIIEAAARKRDENRFVLGPVTLCAGVLVCILLFDYKTACTGLFALAFGDGLASLAGKFFGQCVIPFTKGKTAAGSLTCFYAVFLSSFAVFGDCRKSLVAAAAGMFVELLPLNDFDNLLIPTVVSAVFYFQR